MFPDPIDQPAQELPPIGRQFFFQVAFHNPIDWMIREVNLKKRLKGGNPNPVT
jgi:hypothetical protein